MTADSHSAMAKSQKQGHLLALFSIVVWGTTFISTKLLLEDFTPPEILFIRVTLAILALTLARPRRLRLKSRKHEWYFAGAGLCGVTLYSLLENVALLYTQPGNCSVIISIAPFFVALAVHWFLKGERLSFWFFLGFAVAITGVGLISFSGQQLKLNPLGDFLCILAALSWAGYSVFVKKIDSHGYDTLLVTRHIFHYGLLFLLLCVPFLDFSPSLENLLKPVNGFNFLFLGFGASALCFFTWNTAVKRLGAVKTSVYIYVCPGVTILAAWLLLHDPILPMSIIGAALTLLGLIVSQRGTAANDLSAP